MSEIFEGVLVRNERAELERALAAVASPLSLAVAAVSPGVWAAYRDDPRGSAAFSEEVERVAREISAVLGRALVVRYDSRVGHRSACLYQQGALGRHFGEADETYVGLDAKGYPLEKGQKYRADELDPNKEYETALNAIQIGLEALGGGDWNELHALMTT